MSNSSPRKVLLPPAKNLSGRLLSPLPSPSRAVRPRFSRDVSGRKSWDLRKSFW